MSVRRAPHAIGRRVHGRMVVVSITRREARVLNDVGGRVWELADGRSATAIAEVIAGELGAPLDAVTTDVLAFVRELAGLGFLSVEP